MYSFPNLEPVCCSMSSSKCCFLTLILISQEAGQVIWYSHLFQNFPQFVVIHTVKGFSVVNKAEVYVFLELSYFFVGPTDVGNLISGSSAFDSSVSKESTCNAGDPCSIPGLGRSSGEGIGYPLKYSWASLVPQPVRNLPAMRQTWVCSLGWEDPLKGKATHSSTLTWRIQWTV